MISNNLNHLSVLTKLNKRPTLNHTRRVRRATLLFVNMNRLTTLSRLTITLSRYNSIMILNFHHDRTNKRLLYPMSARPHALKLSTRRHRANNIRVTKFRHRDTTRVTTNFHKLLIRVSTTRRTLKRVFTSRLRHRLRTNKSVLRHKSMRFRSVRRESRFVDRPRRRTRIITISRLLGMNMSIRLLFLLEIHQRLFQRESRFRRDTSLTQGSRNRVTLHFTTNTRRRTSVLNVYQNNLSTRNGKKTVNRVPIYNRTSQSGTIILVRTYNNRIERFTTH